ncbi:MAG: hypothetical protein LUG18_03790 [Candidatus Azobacteroides sp.]|nr:hypothetical protein [Candidatus Azobacteroides sp.]
MSVNVNGETVHNSHGGGIYALNTAVYLRNLEIRRNAAPVNGGGIYCSNSSELRGENLYFFKNLASQGGGMYIGGGSPKFKSLIISENESGIGAGVSSAGASPHFINTVIHSNLGSPHDGYGAGMQIEGGGPVITNSTIIGNFGGKAAGIFIYTSSKLVINNSIVWNNMAAEYDWNTWWFTNVSVENIINWGSTPITYNNSLVEGMDLTSVGGLDATSEDFDPMWISPPAYAYWGGIGSFTLLEGSPCIDKGNKELYLDACGDYFDGWENEYTLTPPPYTISGDSYDDFFGAWYPRDQYSGKKALRIAGEGINIGAFEEVIGVTEPVDSVIRYVTPEGSGLKDGTS